jgi:hypothetical protein
MKRPNKFISFCFLINAFQAAIFIGLFVGLIPIVLISHKLGNRLFEMFGSATFMYIFNGLTFFSFINWIFCIRFWYKNDKYSKAIFGLFFLNALYAPFYYYQVIIKKRPLQNKIDSTNVDTEKYENAIDQKDFAEVMRKNIFEIIELWSSKDKQLDYQDSVPIADVSSELFCQWADSYTPEFIDFREAFNTVELGLLSEFDKELNIISEKTPNRLPEIREFIKTEEWKVLSDKAKEILIELNTAGNKNYMSIGV